MAHKTIDKHISQNHYELINSESLSEFIGKKREIKDKSLKENKINKDDKSGKILYCFNCGWKFPERMSLIRKNIHINKCYEGKGKLDRMKYNEEQKLKSFRNYSNKKVINLQICPICGKNIEGENNIAKQKHLNSCSKLSLIK